MQQDQAPGSEALTASIRRGICSCTYMLAHVIWSDQLIQKRKYHLSITEAGLHEKLLWELSTMERGITIKYSRPWIIWLLQVLEDCVLDTLENQNSISGWNKNMACNFSSQLRQLLSQSGHIPRDGNMPSSDESQMKYKNPQETEYGNYINDWKKAIARRNHHRWWKPLLQITQKQLSFCNTKLHSSCKQRLKGIRVDLLGSLWEGWRTCGNYQRAQPDASRGGEQQQSAHGERERVWRGAREAWSLAGLGWHRVEQWSSTGLNRAQ